jgi:cytochrome oxidase assembly protein ShyY1
VTSLLLTPRWIGRFVLRLLVVAACWWLGSWQWDRGHTEVVRTPPLGTASLVDVHTVGVAVDPNDAGRRVWIRGTFDPNRQVQVVARLHEGQLGSWVVTAMSVDGDASDSAAIPVVRGWLPSGEVVPKPPRGVQRIEGWLEPTEPDTLRDPERDPLPAGELEIVSSPELLSLWRPPLYQGFVIQDRPDAVAPLVEVAAPARVTVNTDWQNTAYAIQWWLFGLFAIFWFGRMVRVELEDVRAAATPGLDHTSEEGRMDPIGEEVDQASDEKGPV